jgi:polyphenol oxidase
MSELPLILPDWPAATNVRAVMTTRAGGVSSPPWESLNLGVHVGDSTASVLENRSRVRKEARLPSEPVWLEQVHGTTVVTLEPDAAAGADDAAAGAEDGAARSAQRADAAVTKYSGVVCAIQVADCMPVLFASREGSVVGAAHAGWRGLAGGVLDATISAMRVPPSDLVAWMGPAIGPKHFEVGTDVVEAFVQSAPPEHRAQTQAAFTRIAQGPKDKWLCDLYTLARLRLAAAGIQHIFGGGWCTVAQAEQFFSYRRDGQTGRMAALIWLSDSSG